VLAWDVAVTVTAVFGGEAGAVYRPVESIVPTVPLPPATPFTVQVTALLLLPVTETVGVNCWVAPAAKVALVGLIVMVTAGAVRVTVATATIVVSAWEVAVTATVVVVGNTFGAVYKPVELTVPMIASPPFSPFTFHVTAVFVEPVTVVVNCWVAPPATLAVVGVMVMATPAAGVLLLPPHPAQTIAVNTISGRNRFMKSPLQPKNKNDSALLPA
jgi:hypothetical protein